MIVDTSWKPGGVLGICDRCGATWRLSQLRKEWTGLKVCPEDFDPPPRDLSPPRVYPEGQAVPGSRPDVGDILGPNTTTPGDL